MKIYKFDVPIQDPNFNGEISYQELYIQSTERPSLEDIINTLNSLHDEFSTSRSNYRNEWLLTKDSFLNSQNFEPHSSSNSFTIQGQIKAVGLVKTKYGKRPITLSIINPYLVIADSSIVGNPCC